MRMSTPYVGTNDYGILTMTQQEIDEAVEDAHRHNFRVAHSRQRRRHHRHGAEGLRERAGASTRGPTRGTASSTARWSIPICCAASRRSASSRRRSGPTPTITARSGRSTATEKMQWMFAHKSFLDTGIPVPGASDYGPGPFEPLMAIQSMVTRKDYNGNVWGPRQKVTVDEALTIATINGAYASHEEHVKGIDHRRQARRFRDAREGPARRQSRRDQGHQRSSARSSVERRCIPKG